MSSDKTTWYLRKPDGSEYGPITTSDMQRWAAQCRIVAGNGVSSDREEWIKVEDIPELEMDWMAHSPDGSEYGPFNIAATQELLDHKVLTEDATLTHKTTKKSVTVQQVLNEEDLFVETEDQDLAQDNNKEQILSEAALKEEEFYTEAQQPKPTEEKNQIKEEQAETTTEEITKTPIDTPENSTTSEITIDTPAETTELQLQINILRNQTEALQAKLQKAKSELTQTRKDLKLSSNEMQAKQDALVLERDQAVQELENLQKKLEKANQKQIKDSEAQAIHCAKIDEQLEKSMQECKQAEAKLARIEDERSEAEQQSLQSVAELRKQTAFMKKNTATLQYELEQSRAIAFKRGRQLIIIITAIGTVAGIMLLTGKPGCRKTEKENDTSVDSQQPVPEEQEDIPLSQHAYSDTTPTVPPVIHPPTKQEIITDNPANSALSPSAWPKIMIEGVKATQSGNRFSMRFDSGVFTTLTIPSSEAKSQLKQIADILRPRMTEFKITVEGCTDNTPMRTTASYNGNHALGLARAETIKKLLVTKGGLSANSITVRYAGEQNAPYPNDTAANRKRNRTVVLKLVRK